MATLDALKNALWRDAESVPSSERKPQGTKAYKESYTRFLASGERDIYNEFVIPQILEIVEPLFSLKAHISILEIGPGPNSLLQYLPEHMRQKVSKYTAFEPNELFAKDLEDDFRDGKIPSLSKLETITVKRERFDAETTMPEKFDLVLFCHSMSGIQNKRKLIVRALGLIDEKTQIAKVVVVHRDGSLQLDGLVCQQTRSYRSGSVHVCDILSKLDAFASFNAGFELPDGDKYDTIRNAWRKTIRTLSDRDDADSDKLLFSSPQTIASFTRHAFALHELTAQVPITVDATIKNPEARLVHPAAVVRPISIGHVQASVRWALKHGLSLTVLGGGHSGHCLQPHVVAVDMSAFDKIHVGSSNEIVVEAGCRTGDIQQEVAKRGSTMPLGARPSVGAGFWLQGGIGHLARLHGLACDFVIGAVVVSVADGRVLHVGHVPPEILPADAVRPEDDEDVLWALKGAGTNFSIVISATFKADAASLAKPLVATQDWFLPLSGEVDACRHLDYFNTILAQERPRNGSSDAYIYAEAEQLRLGVTLFQTDGAKARFPPLDDILGVKTETAGMVAVSPAGLSERELYVAGMHGGHTGGKTSTFKRCVFLCDIGGADVSALLMAATQTRATPLCYLHLLHGGGAVKDIAANATAFGCRDWDFACVVTGVWHRAQDQSEAEVESKAERAAVKWVYKVVKDLLPFSSGIYSADLGADPRDEILAASAFGPNLPRLASLKQKLDPQNILAYACPLRATPSTPVKLVYLVTGEEGAGKDHCADIWRTVLRRHGFRAGISSVSEAIKHEYAQATGADIGRLLRDRAYKEQHRPALSAFFQSQLQQRPGLMQEHFLALLMQAANLNLDALFITGMREDAPVATLSPLVPHTKLVEVRVQACEHVRRSRRGFETDNAVSVEESCAHLDRDYRPNLTFRTDEAGKEAASRFAEDFLLRPLHRDVRELAAMVRMVPNFPRAGIDFRDVINICQQPNGSTLLTSLLKSDFAHHPSRIDAIVCCEAASFLFAPALANQIGARVVPVRKAGKLPAPTVSASTSPSHISSLRGVEAVERLEMAQNVIGKDDIVVVVDDVLATGNTLCAMLQMLREIGVDVDSVTVMAVAEFPAHRGRELLRQRGFGKVDVRSLLVFGGM